MHAAASIATSALLSRPLGPRALRPNRNPADTQRAAQETAAARGAL